MTGIEADKLVSQIDSLSEDEWGKLKSRRDWPLLQDEYLTAKCLTNLWYFAQYGLGWDMRHYWHPLHNSLAHFLTDWTMDRQGVRIPVFMKVVQVAREHCKTWWGVASDLQDMARDTSTSIIIRSFNDKKAFEIVRMEKAQIKENPAFKARFPWVHPALDSGREVEWAKDRFRIESSIVGQRESTVEAYGYTSEATGSHFSKRRYDDIATAQIENSDIERGKMLDCVKHDSNLGQAGTRVLFMGTPYNVRGLFYHFEKGDFSDLMYDEFKQPGEFRAFPQPVVSRQAALGKDRITLKIGDVRLPESSDWRKNLQFCQARILFYSPAVKDTVTEIREVAENDGERIVLNRQVPEIFGQPISVTIGTMKPAAPNRFTLDEIHLAAKDEKSIPRNSLVIKRRELGSNHYSSQILLEPVDPERLILKESDIQYIAEKDLPKEHITVLRTTDFASAKKTASSTAMVTGIWHTPPGGKPMLWIRHIAFGQLKATDILLELFVGILRVEGWGLTLRETVMEEEGRKQTLDQFISTAQDDPYGFFTQMGPPYSGAADLHFADRSRIMVRHRDVTRGRGKKEDRIAAQLQPAFQAKMIGFVEGIEHLDDVLEEVNTFTLDGEGCPHLDLLDTLADQIQYGPSRRLRPNQPHTGLGLWNKTQQLARRRSALEKATTLTWR